MFRVIVATLGGITSLLIISTAARAEPVPFTQPIYPLNCYFEMTSSGTEQPVYSITPEECFQETTIVEEVRAQVAAETENDTGALESATNPKPNQNTSAQEGSSQNVYKQFAKLLKLEDIRLTSGGTIIALATITPGLIVADRMFFASANIKRLGRGMRYIGGLLRL